MSLDTIVDLEITVDSRAPSQEGFGTPLLFGYHTAWLGDLVREYSHPSEMLDDGFTADDDLYKAAGIVKSQQPCPDTFKIGRREVALTQVLELTPTITKQGFVYKGVIGGKTLSVTNGPGATLTTVAAAIATAINTLDVDVTAVADDDIVTCTADNAGHVVDYNLAKGIALKDVTVDTTTDDELATVLAEDDDWYGLNVIDSSSKATSLLVAAFVQTIRKICVVQTCDDEATDAGVEDDVLSALVTSSYARTGGIYHRAIGGVEWLAVGWLAGHLPTQPGSATMAFKSVAGVSADRLSTGQESAILAKNGSHYTRTGGLNITFEGKAGSGDFLDTMRGIDWLYARMRERVLYVLANNLKIPFTDSGVDTMRSAALAVLALGVNATLLKSDPAPACTAPRVKDITPANRINRILPDLAFTGDLAGAIHRVQIRGRIAV